MATDIFMPIDLKSRSASVFSWLSTRKLTCAIALILSDVVHCSKCAFQRQADSGVCRTPTAGRLRYHSAWLRENKPRTRECLVRFGNKRYSLFSERTHDYVDNVIVSKV